MMNVLFSELAWVLVYVSAFGFSDHFVKNFCDDDTKYLLYYSMLFIIGITTILYYYKQSNSDDDNDERYIL